jgi:5-methylcytosine-specific restriction enzyme A
MNRLEFTAKTKRQAYDRSGGLCECALVPFLNRPSGCGTKLTEGRIRYEHIIPDNIAQDNSIDNCAALSLGCWREKTDVYDRKVIAKSNHVRDRARGIKPLRSRPIPGSKASGFKKKFSGEVVRR